jgi:hypothetical protein
VLIHNTHQGSGTAGSANPQHTSQRTRRLAHSWCTCQPQQPLAGSTAASAWLRYVSSTEPAPPAGHTPDLCEPLLAHPQLPLLVSYTPHSLTLSSCQPAALSLPSNPAHSRQHSGRVSLLLL